MDISPQLKNYISEGQSDLIHGGIKLLEYTKNETSKAFDDYSFVVFPFAKAYEGFLKQIFLDAGFITRQDYYSQHFRIGKALSPHIVKRFPRESVYKKMCDLHGCDLSEKVWNTWKRGRNEVFHYFPHNLHSLDLKEAEEIIVLILETMELVIEQLKIQRVQDQLLRYDATSL